MEKPVSLDVRMQYVIRFTPKVKLDYALCHGMLYIDQETLSFSKAEFELDMSDKTKATMVMVDRIDDPETGISRKLSFGKNDIFNDAVTDYWDADFWKGYNIIEPTESLDKEVEKLKKNNASAMALYQ